MEEKIQICPHCGREVSSSDVDCPHCGRPVVIRARKAAPKAMQKKPVPTTSEAPVGKSKRMLRWAVLLLLVAIILYGTYELLG